MELKQVLHMKGGDGEMSYGKNSLYQREHLHKTKSIREEAMGRVYNSIFPLQERRSRVAMAELGCSTGPNALTAARELITLFDRLRCERGHQERWLPEFQVFLNDLLMNDYNTLFQAVPGFYQQLDEELGPRFGSCFVNAVPGSFYGRLFPAQSMHFFNCSSSLHWISQVPKGVERSKGRSPTGIREAYYEQFQRDFSMFLKCRSEELVSGGSMVIMLLGRKDDQTFLPYFFRDFMEVLMQMTSEGLIEEEKMDTFNLPVYVVSIAEIESEVKKEGSFTINQLDAFEYNREDACEKGHVEEDESRERECNIVVGMLRSAMEGLLLSHFGEGLLIDQALQRYKERVRDDMIKEKNSKPYVITVSLTKH